jgi:uncharacterized membrane protein YidH (DUF202 family)
MNPLIPSSFDVVATAVLLIAVGLSFAAFFSMVRSATSAGWHFLVWTLAVFLLPVVGAAAWFATRRRSSAGNSTRRRADG